MPHRQRDEESRGQARGGEDVVTLYLGMTPEVVFAMLACARLGVPHSVVFAGFSSQALRDRTVDCHSRFVITTDEGMRGGKPIGLKKFFWTRRWMTRRTTLSNT